MVLRTSDGARDRPPVKPPSCSRGRHMARPIVRALVSVPVAELRRRPSHASELVTQALLGEPLEIATRTADRKWFRVKRWDGYRGWTRAWSVTPVSVAASEQWEAGLRVLVAARSARVMDAPGGLGRVVFELPLGTRLPELAHRGTWVRVALPDGRAGWVRGSLLAAIPVRPQGQASVLRAAREFTGAPYLWGGVTPWGCDCSGLVQTIFRRCGIWLPRDATDQLRTLRPALLAKQAGSFRPGDLLFFGVDGRSISHVAISTGGLKLIHAYGYVREGNLEVGTRAFVPGLDRLFRAAARPLGRQKKG